VDFSFDLTQGLFSSAGVDAGTQLLLKVFSGLLDSDAKAGTPPPRNVLDAGCGVGVIGICAAAALGGMARAAAPPPGVPTPDVSAARLTVRCQDRDELARVFTLHNAAKNRAAFGRFPVSVLEAHTEPLLAGPGDTRWDLILSNIPAKAGTPVLEDFVRRSLGLLNPGGRVVLVAVNTLADFFRRRIALSGGGLFLEQTGSGHTVFAYSALGVAPAGNALADTALVQAALVETTPTETVPVETDPLEITPEKTALVGTAFTGTASKKTTPLETMPEKIAPMETAPVGAAQEETDPLEITPEKTVPADTSPVKPGPGFLSRYPFYVRTAATCKLEGIPVCVETIHGASGFDEPGGAVTVAAKLAARLGPAMFARGEGGVLVHEPGQGFFPCWLFRFLCGECGPGETPAPVLSGRNVLALEAARHNVSRLTLRGNAAGGGTVCVVPAADLRLGRAALLETQGGKPYSGIVAFPEPLPQSSLPKGTDQLAALWNAVPPLLENNAVFLAAFGSSDAERFDRKKPPGFNRIGTVKRDGFRALAYRFAGTGRV